MDIMIADLPHIQYRPNNNATREQEENRLVIARDMQQKMIDVLDTGVQAHVLGANGNKTDLYITIPTLNNPEKETAFENCVADVNIPVGEVFTSPTLKGTTGKLHVSQVYLRDYNFLNYSSF